MLYLIKSLVVGGSGIGDGPVLCDLLQPQKKVVDNTVRKNKMAVLTIAGSVNDFVQKSILSYPKNVRASIFCGKPVPGKCLIFGAGETFCA